MTDTTSIQNAAGNTGDAVGFYWNAVGGVAEKRVELAIGVTGAEATAAGKLVGRVFTAVGAPIDYALAYAAARAQGMDNATAHTKAAIIAGAGILGGAGGGTAGVFLGTLVAPGPGTIIGGGIGAGVGGYVTQQAVGWVFDSIYSNWSAITAGASDTATAIDAYVATTVAQTKQNMAAGLTLAAQRTDALQGALDGFFADVKNTASSGGTDFSGAWNTFKEKVEGAFSNASQTPATSSGEFKLDLGAVETSIVSYADSVWGNSTGGSSGPYSKNSTALFLAGGSTCSYFAWSDGRCQTVSPDGTGKLYNNGALEASIRTDSSGNLCYAAVDPSKSIVAFNGSLLIKDASDTLSFGAGLNFNVDALLWKATLANTTAGTNTLLDVRTFAPGTSTVNAVGWGGVASGAGYEVSMLTGVCNADGYWNTAPSFIAANGFRPGDHTVSQSELRVADRVEALLGSSSLSSIGNISQALFNYSMGLNDYQSAAITYTCVDPLVLDLNGDGITLSNPRDGSVYFDTDDDGKRQQTGWVAGADGMLVLDKNGNGRIDDISEVFSEFYAPGAADGFAALSTLDANYDGRLDAADGAFADVRVWVDANADAITDAGELNTLADLGIASIDVAGVTTPGEVIAGNEVRARGDYRLADGSTHTIASVDFASNPNGQSWITDQSGVTVSSDGGVSSYTVIDPNGMVVDLAARGVTSAYGAGAKDALIGDSGNNWLAGGGGSDTLSGGAGNDVLIIDAADRQENIDGGDGMDIVNVVGDQGVTFNLTLAHVEVANGGRGDDVLIGGGTGNVFIDGGAGNDVIMGGSADDALSGDDGNDLIAGGAGDDVIRGQRGNDILLGGAGNDVIDGGLGDDSLEGGAGDDRLLASAGNDILDGGDGSDRAVFHGSIKEYDVTHTADGVLVTDRVAGRDGAMLLKNVEYLSFKDISDVPVNDARPVAADDVVDVAASGSYVITAAQLVANDIDYQGDSIALTWVGDATGGTVALNASGNVVFTPDGDPSCVMGFRYKIKDSAGNNGQWIEWKGTGDKAEIQGRVFLRTPDMPTDPQLFDQWYLGDAKVIPVWKDYTGKGVSVGVFESHNEWSNNAIADFTHPDLASSFSTDYLSSPDAVNTFSQHATEVAGVIAGARNGQGGVGVAYDAKLSSYGIGEIKYFNMFRNFDVVNNSWGYTPLFASNVLTSDWIKDEMAGITDAVRNGRNGLGTIVEFSAGNSYSDGYNTNGQSETASRFVITTGAMNYAKDLGAMTQDSKRFSTPGASILVSAAGSNITAPAILLTNEDGDTLGTESESTQGTSFAGPVVSGIAALMLEANPNLGYRDVQKILAYSAHLVADANTDWRYNGATDWNGGGLHVSHDYGFGGIDALAAVRLAETWAAQSTVVNEQSWSQQHVLNQTIPDLGTLTDSIAVDLAKPISVEHAEVVLNLDHQQLGDLIVSLVSPNGTESILMNRPGKDPANTSARGLGQTSLNFQMGSTHDWGENSNGTWTLKVTDAAGNAVGTLQSWELRLYGAEDSADDVYVYTNEFGKIASGARTVLHDDQGCDTINAAAVSGDVALDLRAGTTSYLAGGSFSIAGGAVIENAFTGDGDDSITGSDIANHLSAGRGDDTLVGGGGDDVLDGGRGSDALFGGAGLDTAVFSGHFADYQIVAQGDGIAVVGSDGNDLLQGIERLRFDDRVVFLEEDDDYAISTGTESFKIASGQSITFSLHDLLTNDSNPIGADMQVTSICNVSYGSIALNDDGTATFTPDVGFQGVARFDYTVSDVYGATATASVRVDVGENLVPVLAAPLLVEYAEDAPFFTANLLGGASDQGGEFLSVGELVQTAGPAVTWRLDSSTLIIDPGQFERLASGDTETLVFSYAVTDGSFSLPQTLTVTVDGQNDAPVMSATVSTSVDEDAAVFSANLLAGATDPDNRAVLSVTNLVQTAGRRANFLLSGSDLVFDPAQFNDLAEGQTLELTFGYSVSDGQASQKRTMTVSVQGCNDAPVLLGAFSALINEDAGTCGVPLLAGIMDPDGADTLSVSDLIQTDGPAVDFTLDGNLLLLNPEALGYLGAGEAVELTFAFRVSDGRTAVQRCITINVEGRNDGPVAVTKAATTAEDATLTVTNADLLAGVTDAEGGTVSIISAGSAVNGTVVLDALGNAVFTPSADFNGEAGFDVLLSDGQGGETKQHVVVTVTPEYDPVVLNNQTAVTRRDTLLLGELQAVNPDAGALVYTLLEDGAHGQVTLRPDGSYTYTPIAGFTGQDTFRCRVTDAQGGSDEAEITVAVGPRVFAGDSGAEQISTSSPFYAYPVLVTSADGGFLATWNVYNNRGGGGYDVYVRRYSAAGQAIGNTIHLLATSTGTPNGLQLCALADGGFALTWNAPDDSGFGVFGQCYDADGQPRGVEFQANTYVAGGQSNAQTLALSDGRFLVTWESGGQDGDRTGLYGQLYGANGQAIGGEFQINTQSVGSQFNIKCVALSNGGFVATWTTWEVGKGNLLILGGEFPGDMDVSGQCFGADGERRGDEFRVNTFSQNHQNGQKVAALPDGGFVVVWQSSGPDDSNTDIYCQRYGADGSPVGGEVWVNSYFYNAQGEPAITVLSDGGYVVTWISYGQDGDGGGVFGQCYSADGQKRGGEFQVNTTVAGSQYSQQVTALSDCSFVVTWSTILEGQQHYRRFDANGTPLCAETTLNMGVSVVALAGGAFASIGSKSVNGDSGVYLELVGQSGWEGGSGDDVLVSGGIDEVLIGGGGTDVAVFASNLDQNVVALADDGAVVVAGPGGRDEVREVEILRFRDGDIFIHGTNLVSVRSKSVTVEDGGPLTIAAEMLLEGANDLGGRSLSLFSVANAKGGTVCLTSEGDVFFTPNVGFFGVGGFDYTVANGQGGLATQHVTVDVAPGDESLPPAEPPMGENGTLLVLSTSVSAYTNEDGGPVIADLTDGVEATDPSNALYVANLIQTGGRQVEFARTGTHLVFDTERFGDLSEGDSEVLTFSYIVSDGQTQISRTLAVTVDGRNDGPVALARTIALDEDTSLLLNTVELLSGATDTDSCDTLTLRTVGNASHGRVALEADGSVTFTPDANFNGQAGFDYTVSDSHGGEDTKRVSLTVRPVNDDPTVLARSYESLQKPLSIAPSQLLSGTIDIDGDAVAVTAVGNANHGSVELNTDGSITFTPDEGFIGSAGFDYTVSDGHGGAGTGHASVSVTRFQRVWDDSGETRVNTFTEGDQSNARVARLASGGFVVVWQSFTQDSFGWGIYGQQYDAKGVKVGGEFQANSYFGSNQELPQVMGLADGGYVVVWQSSGQTGSGYSMHGQRFGADGVAIGAEFTISQSQSRACYTQQIVSLADGGIAILWPSAEGAGSRFLVRCLDAAGSAVGDEIRINSADGVRFQPTLAALVGGGFVAVWTSYGQDGSASGVYAQRCDSQGHLVGPELQVNTWSNSNQYLPQVTALADGGFAVVWTSYDQAMPGKDIFGQRYDAYGAPVGLEFRVNTYGLADQIQPKVTALNDGGMVVVWASSGEDGAGYGIFAQRYDALGAAKGGEFRVNTGTCGDQSGPQVTALGDGGMVVVWQSTGQDGSGMGVYAQRFDADGQPVGDETRINAWTAGNQDTPQVVALDGGYAVVWRSVGQDSSDANGSGVYVRTFGGFGWKGGSGDDVIVGDGEVSETLKGLEGDDTLDGGGGNDTLAGGAGNDILTGGTGNDVAVFAGSRFDAVITLGATGEATVTSAEGTDVVHGVETLRFDDGEIFLDRNNAPLLKADVLAGCEDTALVITASSLLANDRDVEGDVLTITAVGNAKGGTVRLNDDGTITFTPRADFYGLSGFDYTVSDGQGGTTTQRATVDVAAVFDPSTANDAAAMLLHDTRLSGVLPVSNVEGEGLTYSLVRGPAHGTVAIAADGGYTYTPQAGYVGADSFTWRITGEQGSQDEATLTVGVAGGLLQQDSGELRVNTYTAGDQTGARMASLADGGFVVVWRSLNQNGNGWGVYGQRYDNFGRPVGGEFPISSRNGWDDVELHVASLGGGGFVVTWEGWGGEGRSVLTQIFDGKGSAVGDEIALRSGYYVSQSNVTTLPNGGAAVVWWSVESNSSPIEYQVRGQCFDAQGLPQGGQFTGGDPVGMKWQPDYPPVVTSLSDGGFIAVWRDLSQNCLRARKFDSRGQAAGEQLLLATNFENNRNPFQVVALGNGGFVVASSQDDGIYCRSYDANGGLLSTDIKVNTQQSYSASAVAITPMADGGYVVTWVGDRGGSFARRYDANGVPKGGEFAVNSGRWAQTPQVTALDNGGFVAVWQACLDGSGTGVYARRFDADGQPVEDDILINAWTTGNQDTPQVVALDGGYAVVWRSVGQDSSDANGSGVYVRTFGGFGWKGGSGDDVIVGDGEASETLKGLEGDDTLDGGGGNDTLIGGSGNDILTGGTGTDVAVFAGSRFDAVITLGATGEATVTSAEGTDVVHGVETLRFDDGEVFLDRNNAPLLKADVLAGSEDTALVITASSLLANDRDVEGDALTITAVGNAKGGTVRLNGDGTITFTPRADFYGTAGFDYSVSDGQGGTATQRATVDVAAVFDPSTANDAVEMLLHDTRLSGALPVSNVEGEVLTYSLVRGPAHGTVEVAADGGYTYTPQAGYVGADSFTWRITGEQGSQDEATLTLGVAGGRLQQDSGELRVNTYTAGDQTGARMASLADGGFVVVWKSLNQNGNGWGVCGQRYDIHGQPVGTEFRATDATTCPEYYDPNVIAFPDGGFAVMWQHNYDPTRTPMPGLYGRFFDNTGAATGCEVQISPNYCSNSSVTSLFDGSAIGLWTSWTPQGINIAVQRFDSAANPLGPELVVDRGVSNLLPVDIALAPLADGSLVAIWRYWDSSTGISGQLYCQCIDPIGRRLGEKVQVTFDVSVIPVAQIIQPLADGGFAVVWLAYNQNGLPGNIFGRRYDQQGNAIGEQFQVNTDTTVDHSMPLVTALADGSMIVIWVSYGEDGSGGGIYAQRFSASGRALGGEFRVNTYTADNQMRPSVAALADGGFVMAWESSGQDGSGGGIYAQRYGAQGQAVGDEAHINVWTDGEQTMPRLQPLEDGGYAVVWQSANQDGSGMGTYLRTFRFSGWEGGAGPDVLTGADTAETLIGLNGDDTLDGGGGDDTLVGGAGDDYLSGGAGTDTYTFGGGGGHDIILNSEAAAEGDTVSFASGIGTDQLWFQQDGNDLKVSIIGTADAISIAGWYQSASNHVSQLKTAEGSTLSDTAVQNLVNAMAGFSPPPIGQTTLTTDQHQQLDAVIAANWKAA